MRTPSVSSLVIVLGLSCPLMHAQGVGVGQRFNLTQKLGLSSGQFAQLFIPDYFTASPSGDFLLVLHLHSASWAAENEVYRSQTNAVLFNIHLGALSSPYQTYFANQSSFSRILDTVTAALRSNNIIAEPRIHSIILTSFSAGYAGVREMLKNADYYNRINALTLADGLHSNSDSETMRIQMQDFLRYARDARDRRKVFLLTHSSIATSGYESTTSTASYLIGNLGIRRIPVSGSDEVGIHYSRSDTGHFHLKGYLGNTADDHLKHLYGMHLMLGHAVGLIDSIATGVGTPDEPAPEGFRLEQNYPNPFNASTTLAFALTSPGNASLNIYNLSGQEVARVANESFDEGHYSLSWDAGNLASGVYFYRLVSNGRVATRKLQLIK